VTAVPGCDKNEGLDILRVEAFRWALTGRLLPKV